MRVIDHWIVKSFATERKQWKAQIILTENQTECTKHVRTGQLLIYT